MALFNDSSVCCIECMCKRLSPRDGKAEGDEAKGEIVNDPVNHPSHYTSSPAKCSKCRHPIECIDVVEHMGFSLGNCIKYIWRAGLKGSVVEDLKKSIWYIEREIQRRANESRDP